MALEQTFVEPVPNWVEELSRIGKIAGAKSVGRLQIFIYLEKPGLEIRVSLQNNHWRHVVRWTDIATSKNVSEMFECLMDRGINQVNRHLSKDQ